MPTADSAVRGFVPDALLSWVTGPDGTPEGQVTVEGVVLYCDISGFTRAASRLVERGSEGLHQLTLALNSMFDRWITAVRANEGHVATFIGDALVAVWGVEDPGDHDRAVRSAAEAARAILRASSTSAVAESVELGVKCGVGIGEIGVVGLAFERGHRNLVVHGDALERAVTAAAGGGTEAVPSYDPPSGRQLPRLPPGPVSDDAARSFVSPTVRERLAAGQGAWLAELRRVSIVIVGLPSVEGAEALRSVAAMIDREVEPFESHFEKVSVDDKGTFALYAFGAPLSHENDPERAIWAAVAVHDRLRAAGIEHSVGVATGRAFCGAVGNDLRREYTVIGHVVNLASRLMAERDGLLVDAATAAAVDDRFTVTDRRTVRLRGIADPVEVGRPVRRPVVHGNGAAVVGRRDERRLIDALVAGAGVRGLVLEGVPGIGKSTLARYAVSRWEAATSRPVVIGRGSLTGRRQPYGVWREALVAAVGRQELADRSARLATRLPWFALRRPLVAAITQEQLDDTDLTRQLSGAVRADNTRAALVALMDEILADALVVVEDAHWIDSASWALLAAVAEGLPRVRLLVTHRPLASPPAALTEIATLPRVRQETLTDLAPPEVEELVRTVLEVDEVPVQVLDDLVARGGANPLFAEQLLYAMVDSGRVVAEDRRLRLATTATGTPGPTITDTIESIVTSRIDLMPPSAQLTLKVSSVIGLRFELDMLSDVHPVAGSVDEDADQLAARQLWRAATSPPPTEFEFAHALIRDVAYNLLPVAERSALHARVAGWYERNGAAAASPALLAHHHLAAGAWTAAAPYLERAADEALGSHSNAEAVRQLRTLVALVDDGRIQATGPRLAGWLRRLGDAQLGLARYADARAAYHRALALHGHPFPTSRLRQGSGAVAAFAAVTRRRGAAPATGDPTSAEVAWMLELLSQMAYFDQNMVEMLHCTLRAVGFAERSGDPRSLSRAHGAWSVVAGLSGLRRLAARANRRALQEAAAEGGLPTIGYANLLHGILHYATGDWDEAEDGFTRALAAYETLGATADHDLTNAAYAWMELFRGDGAAADARLRLTSDRPSDQVRLWAAAGPIVAAALRAEPVDPDHLDRLQAAAVTPGLEKGDALLAWGVLALAASTRDDHARARTALVEVRRWVRGLPAATAYTGFGLLGAIVAAGRLPAGGDDGWPAGAARRLARRSARHLRVGGLQNPVLRPLADLGHAHLARSAWRRRRRLARARRRAAALGTAYVEPLIESLGLDPGPAGSGPRRSTGAP